jgi:Fic family protein
MNIKNSPSGRIIQTMTGYQAFLPNPLPPTISWNLRLINTLSRADQVIGKLAGEGNKLPNPHLLLRPFITREAVLSSKIEGTQATVGEILAYDAGAIVHRSPDDLKEVKNYIDALEYGLKRLSSLPLSLRLLKELHEILMSGVRGQHATPGDFRKTQNWIGLPGCTLATAKYVPPTPEVLMDCLAQFENFLHDKTLPPLVHIALCHYQFEAIHPFLDGNGRMGRLLITLLLIERNVLPSPLLYLSAFFEATRDDYYRQLNNVSTKGTWDEWLEYFLNGVAVQSSDVLSRAARINQLISNWLIDVAGTSSNLPAKIVEYLAVNPFLTTNKVASYFGIAFTTAQRAIQKLETAEVLSQVGNAKRDKLYCAKKILEILEEPAQINEGLK